MKLIQLMEQLTYECVQGGMDKDITEVVYDSRKVTKGCLFLCIIGANFDGHQAAQEAAEKGAAAIVVSKDVPFPCGKRSHSTEGGGYPVCAGMGFCRILWLSGKKA